MIFNKNMTQEELKFLSEYESNFKTAINSNYTRNIVKSKLEKMVDIYQRETGKPYNLCTHCSTSVLAFLKVIGKMYFEIVQQRNEPNVIINDLQKTVTKTENKKEKTIKKNGKYKSGEM